MSMYNDRLWAAQLSPGRLINGVLFDGTQDITIGGGGGATFSYGLLSARPAAAGNNGNVYYAYDIGFSFRSNNTTWDIVGVGSQSAGTADQILTYTSSATEPIWKNLTVLKCHRYCRGHWLKRRRSCPVRGAVFWRSF